MREEEAEGSKPAGQEEAGKATHKPAAAATARTTATERAANAPRLRPKEDAEKTTAAGNWARKNSSTPLAQPRKTAEPTGARGTTEERTAEETPEREPEKPKAEKREKTEDNITKTPTQ